MSSNSRQRKQDDGSFLLKVGGGKNVGFDLSGNKLGLPVEVSRSLSRSSSALSSSRKSKKTKATGDQDIRMLNNSRLESHRGSNDLVKTPDVAIYAQKQLHDNSLFQSSMMSDSEKSKDDLLINYNMKGKSTPFEPSRKMDAFRYQSQHVQNRVSSMLANKNNQ